ncbi:C40 family peptidase [Desulfosporosinus meridiei]|uniref:Cell wall-associated hydrolase, invasion-associated protein n=1 Tax=Desulfosporosinus meridiei (strain ATCC BAA-275 / DSM 13257 / KCTC 12902 / NCIMB 13706 / S10) TaxID=768704 RepID=J7ISD6_DESMD|nr:C40 family peptidase [Desulfosporosinus meridiei]AFQ44580.1 cell wall-associated hydrolase, invasion-associated protein [Desulfosporosinus meridiei DSM 13257]
MVSSSTRKWLGSITFAGLVLASSLPVLASSEQSMTTTSIPMKPVLVASAEVSDNTYTQTVRKQLQWTEITTKISDSVASIPTPEKSVPEPITTQSASVTVAEKAQPTMDLQTAKKVQTAKKAQAAKSETKAVQVAEAPKQQVSRSSDSTLVSNALSLTGVPYVFGGTSKKGFDCSGYTQYVFKGSGISLPRTSSAQFNVGTPVKKDELQSGDLVFFSTYAKGPSHVGVYIGGGKFVHASNSGVRTTSLNDSYYSGRYVGARRVN